MKFSKKSLSWAGFILLSSFFMRQVLNMLTETIGRKGVGMFIFSLYGSSGIFFTAKAVLRKISLWKIAALCLILFFGYRYAAGMKILEERIHLIKYGILGWLVMRDNSERRKFRIGFFVSLVFCSGIASLDEMIQWFLPYRVGDLRDVGFGFLGAMLGSLLFLILDAGGTELALH